LGKKEGEFDVNRKCNHAKKQGNLLSMKPHHNCKTSDHGRFKGGTRKEKAKN
jgi:hypothetical protein